MSFTSQNLLDMAEALATGVDNVSTIDHVMPSPILFTSKADFFATVNDDNDTKAEIETGLVRAAEIRYLNFELLDEEDARELEAPIVAVNFECTVFHERKLERLDETAPLDDFDKKVRKSNQEHITAVMGIVGEFQGSNPVPALTDFPEAYTVTPVQDEGTEMNVECDFIQGVIGDQTKLGLQIRVQMPC